MPANFNLVLDTTGPGGVTVSLDAAATFSMDRDVLAVIGTSDGDTTNYQVKIYGDVEAGAIAGIEPLEANASWITYVPGGHNVRVSVGDGVKTVKVKLRDDVWNESAEATDQITLDTTVPVLSISAGPDVPKISKIAGKRTAAFSFSSDSALQAWKVKAVPNTNSIHTAGTQIGVVNGSTNMSGGALAAATTVNPTIDGRDLELASSGDGTKIIKVFGQDLAGNWSL